MRIIRDPATLVGKGIGYLLFKDRDAVLKALTLHNVSNNSSSNCRRNSIYLCFCIVVLSVNGLLLQSIDIFIVLLLYYSSCRNRLYSRNVGHYESPRVGSEPNARNATNKKKQQKQHHRLMIIMIIVLQIKIVN